MLSVIQKITEQNTGGLDLEHINKNIHIYKSEYDKTKYYFKKCMQKINMANKSKFTRLPSDEFQYFSFYFNYLQKTKNIFWDSEIFKYKDFLTTPESEYQMVHMDDSIRHQLISLKNPLHIITINLYNNLINPYDVKQYNTRFIRNISYITLPPGNRMQRWLTICHDLLLKYLNEEVLCKTITKNDRELCREIYEGLLLHKDLQDLLTEKIKMSKLFS